MKKLRYSEIFGPTPQGEGNHTGKMTIWVRLFACNLTCAGFGQKDPTDPSTYIEPYKTIDLSNITKLEDLPVFSHGCDSSYSWSARFKHLAHEKTAEEMIEEFRKCARAGGTNPKGLFTHPITKNQIHLAFTGGEPMASQKGIIDIMETLMTQDDFPWHVTVETNGTKSVTPDLLNTITKYQSMGGQWTWSVSPKLFNVSGEPNKRAIVPTALDSIFCAPGEAYLKFVITNKDAAWDELDDILNNQLKDIRHRNDSHGDVPIWIMPVGATAEQQKDDEVRLICERALRNGFHISARVHCYIWGNLIGV